jgi:hypothetical protein
MPHTPELLSQQMAQVSYELIKTWTPDTIKQFASHAQMLQDQQSHLITGSFNRGQIVPQKQPI